MEYALCVDLVGDSHTRPERVWIIVFETAITTSAPMPFILCTSKKVPCRWIRNIRAETRCSVLQFMLPWLHVIAESIRKRQLSGHLPRVLGVDATGAPY